jgi:hypothetical protein
VLPTEDARISVTLGFELISYSNDGVNRVRAPEGNRFVYLFELSRSWMPFGPPRTIHPMQILVYLTPKFFLNKVETLVVHHLGGC